MGRDAQGSVFPGDQPRRLQLRADPRARSAHAENTAPYRIDPNSSTASIGPSSNRSSGGSCRSSTSIITKAWNSDPEKHHALFVALWRQISQHYKGYPLRVGLRVVQRAARQVDLRKMESPGFRDLGGGPPRQSHARWWSVPAAGTASTNCPSCNCPRKIGT